ncbi:MAG TPA: hypothetical protein P5556_06015 [Candidatus Gastranaerophilales bacterium]|nr:hypothetical protein [Candidatus Gastranaerophilales bacterium]
MNKNFKVFQLHGLSGLLLLGFTIAGLFCGFVLSPIWVIMIGWNELVSNIFNGPAINYYQASLLWIFLALCSYLILKNSISIKIHSADDADSDEITGIITEKIVEEKERAESEN